MKRQLFTASMMAIGICALLIVANADDQPGQNDNQNDQNSQTQQRPQIRERPQAGQGQDAEAGKTVRASELIGKAIESPEGENIGQIDDLVIEASTGEVVYAAVTYSARPDARNKIFAVPFQAFEAKHDPATEECTIVLDVTPQQLEHAEGFPANNWPDFSDLQFTSGIDELYGVERNEDDHSDEQQQERPRTPGARP